MRIWFNHWFSTAYHLINMMKADEQHKFHFIGTSTNADAVYKQACDEWYSEPHEISADDYISFCLNFCAEHNVEVFVPRRFLVEIIKQSAKFANIGVKLFADLDAKTIEILDNKIATYDFFTTLNPNYIPEIRVARSFEEFILAYELLKNKSTRVCYKLAIDEGARSFRVIDNSIESLTALLNKPGAKVTLDAAKQVLKSYDFFNPIIVMPYLSGVEISVDCLSTASGDIIIPRYKTNKRYSEIIFDEHVMSECRRIIKTLGFHMPLNIQFKKENDKLYLLEINPRMSGGLQLSCKATGINLPNIAINQLLGVEREWSYPDNNFIKVAHIETPICLN